MSAEIKNKIIENGVKNLREFGYPNVTKENILTDEVYSNFFLNMLQENKGSHPTADIVIEELEKQIKSK